MTPDDSQNWFCTWRSTGKPLHWLENAFDEGLPTGISGCQVQESHIQYIGLGWSASQPPYCLGFLPLVKFCEWQFWISKKNSNRSYIHFDFAQQLSDQSYFITFGCVNSYVNELLAVFTYFDFACVMHSSQHFWEWLMEDWMEISTWIDNWW